MDLRTDSESSRYTSRRRPWQPARVIVDASVSHSEVTTNIIARCSNAEIHEIRDARDKTDRAVLVEALGISGKTPEPELKRLARTSLFLTESTELLQQMAAGPAMERRCFNFLKILPYTGVCPYDCAYCWFKDPVLIPRVNVRFFDQLPEALNRLRREGRTPTVFTFTHYKTDCFTMEHLTGFCRRAADFFETEPGFAIQFLTKSDQVDCLLQPAAAKKIIVTFSVNPTWITTHVDVATPPLEARLLAAQRLQAAGIPVMLRVDPMFVFENWQAAYDDMVKAIFAHFEPVHVTLGTPRFQDLTDLSAVVEGAGSPRARKFMTTQATQMGVSKPGRPQTDESFRSHFKNMSVSYPDAVRVSLYRTVADAFLRRNSKLLLGLCEEPAHIWEEVGLRWTGDKTQDCSCNFVPATMTALFSPEERVRVARQAEEARREDAVIAGQNTHRQLRVIS
jgi:DNA repair photolyase